MMFLLILQIKVFQRNLMRINVLLRIKEVGMLRAIGFSTTELKKMMRNEGFIYGIFACVGGCTNNLFNLIFGTKGFMGVSYNNYHNY